MSAHYSGQWVCDQSDGVLRALSRRGPFSGDMITLAAMLGEGESRQLEKIYFPIHTAVLNQILKDD